jgi:hypothetical protein
MYDIVQFFMAIEPTFINEPVFFVPLKLTTVKSACCCGSLFL